MKYSFPVLGLYVIGLMGCGDPTHVPEPVPTAQRSASVPKPPVPSPPKAASPYYYPVVMLPPKRQLKIASPGLKKLFQRFHLQMDCQDHGAVWRSRLAEGKFGKHVSIKQDKRHGWARRSPYLSTDLVRPLAVVKDIGVPVAAIGCDGKPRDRAALLGRPKCDLMFDSKAGMCQRDSLVSLQVEGRLHILASMGNRLYLRRADGSGRTIRHDAPGPKLGEIQFVAVNRTQKSNKVLALSMDSSAKVTPRLWQLSVVSGSIVLESIDDSKISKVAVDYQTPECNEHGDCLVKLVNAEGKRKWLLRTADGSEYEWSSPCTPLIKERPAKFAKALPKAKNEVLKALVEKQCCKDNVCQY